MSSTESFIQYLDTPVGVLQICASKSAITHVTFVSEASHSGHANAITAQAKVQLQAYFAGQRQAFDLPLEISGTVFQQSVWQALCELEYGQTCSYGHIAQRLNNPKAVRAVGAANGKNKIAIIIPCHRVIGANGTLTGYAGGLQRKSYLLNLEQEQLAHETL